MIEFREVVIFGDFEGEITNAERFDELLRTACPICGEIAEVNTNDKAKSTICEHFSRFVIVSVWEQEGEK